MDGEDYSEEKKEKEPLYEDDKIKITVFAKDPEVHELHLLNPKSRYLLLRGTLRELARTPRKKLESKLNLVNSAMLYEAREQGLDAKDIGIAICQAYIEEEERFRREGL